MHKFVLVGGLLAVLVACSGGSNAVVTTTPSSASSTSTPAPGDPPPVGSTPPGTPPVTPPVGGTTPPPTPPPPTIGGTPRGAVVAEMPYSFTPSSGGPSGDTLTFSVQNTPSWASFNSSTGELSGTPTAADVGTFSSIGLSVSDGARSASLAKFSIVVTATANGSVTLTWAPPTFNTDETALTNLAGYRIYYGNSANALTQTIQVTNAGATDYVVDNLSPGTWYFAISALSSADTESRQSTVTTSAVL
jgi:hypothetical protein